MFPFPTSQNEGPCFEHLLISILLIKEGFGEARVKGMRNNSWFFFPRPASTPRALGFHGYFFLAAGFPTYYSFTFSTHISSLPFGGSSDHHRD